jgi:hypothetical protein
MAGPFSNEDQLEKGRRIRNPINQGSKVTFLGEENTIRQQKQISNFL